MNLKKDDIISAQAILQPRGGRRFDGTTAITAGNVTEYAPEQSVVEEASTILKDAGFDIGPMVGVSFSITGKVTLFEKFLGRSLRRSKDGGIEVVMRKNRVSRELAGEDLPKELRKSVDAISFPRPPEFGPTGFSS